MIVIYETILDNFQKVEYLSLLFTFNVPKDNQH